MLRTSTRLRESRRAIGLPIAIAVARSPDAASARPAHAQQPLVEEFVLDDTIQPVSAGQLDRALARANSDGAAALLIEMDTPGGLVDSMRTMAGAILSSRVPVIVYVAPPGRAPARPAFSCWRPPTSRPWRPEPMPARPTWCSSSASPTRP